jgi:hypothetical protein
MYVNVHINIHAPSVDINIFSWLIKINLTHPTSAQAYLKSGRAVCDYLRGVPERAAGLVLALSGDDLGPGLPGRLSLGGHGALELLRHADVLHLHPLHLDAPRVRRLVQGALKNIISPFSSDIYILIKTNTLLICRIITIFCANFTVYFISNSS